MGIIPCEPSWHRKRRRVRTQARTTLRCALSGFVPLDHPSVVRAQERLRGHHSASSLPSAVDSAAEARRMSAPWKCHCGNQCKAAAEFCANCGSNWRQSYYGTDSTQAYHQGGWWRTRSPRSRQEQGGGKGKAKEARPFSPRRRGKGKGGQQDGSHRQQCRVVGQARARPLRPRS